MAVPAGSGRNCFTLQPLGKDGADSIEPAGIVGLLAVRLTQIHFTWDNFLRPTLIWMAADLFDLRAFEDPLCALIPASAVISRAVFSFYFADSPTPRSVSISPPFKLELERPSDAEIVQRWASLHGFLTSESSTEPSEQAMAMSG